MAPLIVMLAAWLVARSVGTAGLWLQADSWTGALRIALVDRCSCSRPSCISIPARGPT